jgi:hypothetical protein
VREVIVSSQSLQTSPVYLYGTWGRIDTQKNKNGTNTWNVILKHEISWMWSRVNEWLTLMNQPNTTHLTTVVSNTYNTVKNVEKWSSQSYIWAPRHGHEISCFYATFTCSELTGSLDMSPMTMYMVMVYALFQGELVKYVVSGSLSSTTHRPDKSTRG